jgi:hypothetical protein
LLRSTWSLQRQRREADAQLIVGFPVLIERTDDPVEPLVIGRNEVQVRVPRLDADGVLEEDRLDHRTEVDVPWRKRLAVLVARCGDQRADRQPPVELQRCLGDLAVVVLLEVARQVVREVLTIVEKRIGIRRRRKARRPVVAVQVIDLGVDRQAFARREPELPAYHFLFAKIAEPACERVADEATAVVVASGDPPGDLFLDDRTGKRARDAGFVDVVRPAALHVRFDLVARLTRLDQDRTRDGSATVDRALRPAQDLDALDIEQVLVDEVQAGSLNAVDEHGDRRLTALHCRDATHRDVENTAPEVLERLQVRRQIGEILERTDARVRDVLLAEDGDLIGHPLQELRPPAGRHQHLLEIGRRRFRGLRRLLRWRRCRQQQSG